MIVETDDEDRPTGRRFRVVREAREPLEGWPQWLRFMVGLLGLGILIPYMAALLVVLGGALLLLYFIVASFFH